MNFILLGCRTESVPNRSPAHAASENRRAVLPSVDLSFRSGFTGGSRRHVRNLDIQEASRLGQSLQRDFVIDEEISRDLFRFQIVDDAVGQHLHLYGAKGRLIKPGISLSFLEAYLTARSRACASLGDGTALYEPSHGSAPDIAGKGIANPLAQILSVEMMLRYSFNLGEAADDIRRAVTAVLDEGWRTGDIKQADTPADKVVGTVQMGDLVVAHL